MSSAALIHQRRAAAAHRRRAHHAVVAKESVAGDRSRRANAEAAGIAFIDFFCCAVFPLTTHALTKQIKTAARARARATHTHVDELYERASLLVSTAVLKHAQQKAQQRAVQEHEVLAMCGNVV
jgi:hypothetical protein